MHLLFYAGYTWLGKNIIISHSNSTNPVLKVFIHSFLSKTRIKEYRDRHVTAIIKFHHILWHEPKSDDEKRKWKEKNVMKMNDTRNTKFVDVWRIALFFHVMYPSLVKRRNMKILGWVSKSPKFGALLTMLEMLLS